MDWNYCSPDPKDLDDALRRVEMGVATSYDADLIRQYIGELDQSRNMLRDRLRFRDLYPVVKGGTEYES